MKILVTGGSGFIASNLSIRLAELGFEVVSIDNNNSYYSVDYKYSRLREIGFLIDNKERDIVKPLNNTLYPNFFFYKLDISDKESLMKLFKNEQFDVVVNLAAQAGVRYSITHPDAYISSNIVGFENILECCRHFDIKHLVYASSSSVYGLNSNVPFKEGDKVDTPVSLYAATKKSNELMAHVYSNLYGIPTTGLRYFTVYGPWGRPDMAPILFAIAIAKGETIKIFNNGDMRRDFTFIDDIVNGTIKVINHIPKSIDSSNGVPAKVYNIGCGHTEKLMDFIKEIEINMGKEAKKEFLPMQPGDVYQTYADTSKLQKEIGYCPEVSLHDGIKKFIDWFKSGKNSLI